MQVVYPDLPVARRRDEILAAMRKSRVVVVVGETGSGKTTQLPKMALELAQEEGLQGRVGCTQPRRLAATSVAARVAEEMKTSVGGLVGYQVRFDERVGKETEVKFMTDGILLAETQGDRELRQYHTIIIDEAHERSLNIDFLLGYLHRLLERRKDLRVVISSATMDAGKFAEFFGGDGKMGGDGRGDEGADLGGGDLDRGRDAPGTACGETPQPRGEKARVPIVEVEGRTYPVEDHFLPEHGDERLADHVARAVEWIGEVDETGDILVFLPGEREIRDCAKMIEGRDYDNTEVLPVFARLSLAEQQRVFQSSRRRRVILATNVAETSLTIPGIVYVIDSGLARVNRFSPQRQIQRLQVEKISQASARQRRGRCGRVRDGVCVRLYDEEWLEGATEFTDPEIRRSSLAGVILRMRYLGLGDVQEFPFLDPPSTRAVTEGYATLEEVGAIDDRRSRKVQRRRDGRHDDGLTDVGRELARLPLDPRLGRMLLAARRNNLLGEMLIIVAGLSVMDVRERPAEKEDQADKAHLKFESPDSDFLSLLNIWHAMLQFRKPEGGFWRSKMRKYCQVNFLSMRRMMEWESVVKELGRALTPRGGKRPRSLPADMQQWASADDIHKCLLAGMPTQIGEWDKEKKIYRGTGGRQFAVFPGSGMFGNKRPEWVLAFDLVETSRLWARKLAAIEPEWVEEVAPQACKVRYHSPHWDAQQGAVYGKETVMCGGLTLVPERRVHYGRIDPKGAHEVFVREGILEGGLLGKAPCLDRLKEVRDEILRAEHKLRRVGGLWCDEGAYDFYLERVPEEIATAKAFHDWRRAGDNEGSVMIKLSDVVWEEVWDELARFPDEVWHGEKKYSVVYCSDAEAEDVGVCFEVHVDALLSFPDYLPGWGVPGIFADRVEMLVRSLPKGQRTACFPIGEAVDGFLEEWGQWEPDRELFVALAEFLSVRSGHVIDAEMFDVTRLPDELRPKLRVVGDEGKVYGIGEDVQAAKDFLAATLRQRREDTANLEWEMTGGTFWSFGELPVLADGIYPALVDEGESVGTRAFLDQREADESHRAGCVRLFFLDQAEQVGFVQKRFPLGPGAKLMAGLLGGARWVEELLRVAAEGALLKGGNGVMPRSEEEFAVASREGKGLLFASAEEIAVALEDVVGCSERVRNWMEKNRDERHLREVVEDLEEQMLWLMGAGFAWKAGFGRLRGYQRYFRGIEERLERLGSQPLIRDEEKRDQFRPLWDRWVTGWQTSPEAARRWEAGWLLEEWRMQLFAPGQPREVKSSAKRVEVLLDEL